MKYKHFGKYDWSGLPFSLEGRKLGLLAVALILCMAVVAVGCNNGNDSGNSSGGASQNPDQPALPAAPAAPTGSTGTVALPGEASAPTGAKVDATMATGQPKYGGTISVHVTADPSIWDVSRGVQSDTDPFLQVLYEAPVQFKLPPEVGYTEAVTVPGLVESWEVSGDVTQVTFHLTKGVHFANMEPVNGREMTSADFKFSFEYLTRIGEFAGKQEYFSSIKLPTPRFAYLAGGLTSIEALDKYTVVLNFDAPFAPFLNYMGDPGLRIMPREIYDRDGHFKDTAVGTGPFQIDVEASHKGSSWIMNKHDNYRIKGRPYMDQMRYLVIPDNSTAFAAFKVGQLDVVLGGQLAVEEFNQLKRSNPKANFASAPGPSTDAHIYMNVRRAPFDNLKVRQAVSYCIDRKEFVNTFTGGIGGPAMAAAFGGMFTDEEIYALVPHDPVKGKQLLAEAGYPDGLNFDFFGSVRYGEIYSSRVQLLQAQFKKCGMTLNTKYYQHPEYLSLTRGNTFDMTFRGKGVNVDIDSYLTPVFSCGDSRNYAGICDAKLDEQLKTISQEADPVNRLKLIRENAKYINVEKAWGLAIYLGPDLFVWSERLQDYNPHWPSGANGYPGIEKAWLK